MGVSGYSDSKEENGRNPLSMYQKFPRTPHFKWSGSASSDDVWIGDVDHFYNSNGTPKDVVVTSKLDGECTTMYRDHIHARSADGGKGVGRSWVKQLHGQIKNDIPDEWRVVGENLYAAHSIWYWDLPSYFFVFSVFDEYNVCLSWDDTKCVAAVLGLETVPVLYEGPFDVQTVRSYWNGKCVFRTFETPHDHRPTIHAKPTGGEGYVCRVSASFPCKDYGKNVAKMVRAGHVTTTQHWSQLPELPNKLLRSGI